MSDVPQDSITNGNPPPTSGTWLRWLTLAWLCTTAGLAVPLWRIAVFAEWEGHLVEETRYLEATPTSYARTLLRLRLDPDMANSTEAADSWSIDRPEIESVEDSSSVWVRFQLFHEDLVRIASTPREAMQELFQLRLAVTDSFGMWALIWAVAGRVWIKRGLWKWDDEVTRIAMGGGLLLYLIAWTMVFQQLRIPERIYISLWTWLFAVVTTYPWIVIAVVALWDVTQGRTGWAATSLRGIVLIIAYGAGAVMALGALVALVMKLLLLIGT